MFVGKKLEYIDCMCWRLLIYFINFLLSFLLFKKKNTIIMCAIISHKNKRQNKNRQEKTYTQKKKKKLQYVCVS